MTGPSDFKDLYLDVSLLIPYNNRQKTYKLFFIKIMCDIKEGGWGKDFYIHGPDTLFDVALRSGIRYRFASLYLTPNLTILRSLIKTAIYP